MPAGLRNAWRWGLSCFAVRCPVRHREHGSSPPAAATAAEGDAAHSEAADEEQICRFCFEGPGEAGELISPCRCAGGQKYVHLSCLRSWQRAVLIAQPTHPDLYDIDTRQRICNVCKAEFNCPPPTRAELMATFTGPELAALIEEGCIIASAESFSRELEQQIAGFPQAVQERIVCRNWIRGAFLITQVVAEHERGVVQLRISDAEDLAGLVERLGGDMRTLHLRGRRYSLLLQGPLGGLGEGSTPAELRAALTALATPVTVMMQRAGVGDCGNDGIMAVNMTRPVKIVGLRQRTFLDAVARVVGPGEQLQARITHFIGGPCEEGRVAVCAVVVDGQYTLAKGDDCLEDALRGAEAILRAHAVAAEVDGATRTTEGPCTRHRPTCGPVRGALARRIWSGATKIACRMKRRSGVSRPGSSMASLRPKTRLCKRARVATSSSDVRSTTPEKSRPSFDPRAAEAPNSVEVLVFWGYAGWSRCQLMGEIARGSWGLCRAPPAVLRLGPAEVWQELYPRLIFAPKNAMSEAYDGQAPEEEERRRELRRMAIFHDLLLRQTGRARQVALAMAAAGEGGGETEEEPAEGGGEAEEEPAVSSDEDGNSFDMCSSEED